MAFYSDLNYIKPEKGPILEDLAAIYQAVYTIFKTTPGERLFHPTWGGCLDRYKFEPCDEITARSMFYDITEALKQEPRVDLDTSKSYVIPDPVNSQFFIQLKFNAPGFSDYESTLSLTFKQ